MIRLRPTLGLIAQFLAVGAATPLLAQDPGDVRLGITYTPGYVPVLAVAVDGDPALAAIAAKIDTILGTDLDYSDRFEIRPLPDSLRTSTPINYGLLNELGVPEGYRIYAPIVVGYPKAIPDMPERKEADIIRIIS